MTDSAGTRLVRVALSAAILMVDFSERLVQEKIDSGEGLAQEGERSN